MKRLLAYILTIAMLVALCGCAAKQPTAEGTVAETTTEAATEAVSEVDKEAESPATEESQEAKELFKIVYTNDVHSYVENTRKNADDIEEPALRLSNVAAYIDDLKAEGRPVLAVDAGDLAEGSVYGSYDLGTSVMKMAKLINYDVMTPGNHECDYGKQILKDWCIEYELPYVSCNFKNITNGQNVLPSYKICEVGGKKVGIVGVSSTETITSSTPTYYQDENGNFLFSVDGAGDKQELYDSVQKAVDEIRNDVDYVIILGHVGIDKTIEEDEKSSRDIIKNTTGIDAFIDGHSHTVMPCEIVQSKDGKDVVLTQTGCYLGAFGVMTVMDDGTITSELLTGYDRSDESVKQIEDELYKNVEESMGEVIARSDVHFYINNPKNHDERIIRAMETNAGDFVPDSIYWYFNDKLGLDCDIVIQNAGGIRGEIEEGEVKVKDIKSVSPFGNQLCMVKVTGQDVIDALECGVTVVGQFDPKWNAPAENGGFMHVAGMKYNIDASVPSGVKRTKEGLFDGVEGEYRIKDVMVYDKKEGKYVPIDPKGTYTVAGANYVLRNSGDGLVMFANSEMVTDFVGQDYLILKAYVENFKETEGMPLISTKNSPLAKYDGYLINYEDPFGAGRIKINNAEFEIEK